MVEGCDTAVTEARKRTVMSLTNVESSMFNCLLIENSVFVHICYLQHCRFTYVYSDFHYKILRHMMKQIGNLIGVVVYDTG